jgi:hypothetical protein
VRNSFALCFIAISAFLAFIASPAAAQALTQRTWVSGTGDDANACSRTAPCRSFAGAISKTSIHGEIDCLDSAEFFTVIIQKSVTIDCKDAIGSVNNAGVATGIDIKFNAFDPSDTLKQVNLRNLTVQGIDNGERGILIEGVGQATFVSIENCVIDGNYSGVGDGINDLRSRGALAVDNTIVRNNGNGIAIQSFQTGSLRAVITNTHVLNSGSGIVVGPDVFVVLDHSVVSNNSIAGVNVLASGLLVVDSTTISHNGNGIQNSGTVRVSNSNFILNTAAISGSVNSFSNNRFSNNTTLGTIIPIGTAANPTGQQ